MDGERIAALFDVPASVAGLDQPLVPGTFANEAEYIAALQAEIKELRARLADQDDEDWSIPGPVAVVGVVGVVDVLDDPGRPGGAIEGTCAHCFSRIYREGSVWGHAPGGLVRRCWRAIEDPDMDKRLIARPMVRR